LKRPDNRKSIPLLIAADRHLKELADIKKLNLANHGLFQLTGVVGLCRAVPQLSTCKTAEPWALERMQEVLETQFNHEGMHMEHSPGYHFWALDKILAIKNTGWFGDIFDLQIEKAQENKAWLFHPNGYIISPGDTFRIHQKDIAARHPYLLAKVTNGEEGVFPEATDQIWWDTGYAILRSPWQAALRDQSFLFLNGAFHSLVHKHYDDLTIEWSEFGEQILVDTGAYSYQNSPLRRYAQSTKAHNTVEIDHKNFSYRRSGENSLFTEFAYGSALKSYRKAAGLKFLEAEVDHLNENVIHNRKIFLKERQWLLLVDELQGIKKHDYVQWFHFHPDLDVVDAGNGYEALLPISKKQLYIIDLVTGKPGILVKGQESPFLQGWFSPGNNKAVANSTVGYSRQASKAIYATLFTFEKPDEGAIRSRVDVDSDWFSICWLDPNGWQGVTWSRKDQILMECRKE
jgi:hypothetical protein